MTSWSGYAIVYREDSTGHCGNLGIPTVRVTQIRSGHEPGNVRHIWQVGFLGVPASTLPCWILETIEASHIFTHAWCWAFSFWRYSSLSCVCEIMSKAQEQVNQLAIHYNMSSSPCVPEYCLPLYPRFNDTYRNCFPRAPINVHTIFLSRISSIRAYSGVAAWILAILCQTLPFLSFFLLLTPTFFHMQTYVIIKPNYYY